ncbi:uncharacterized protein LOC128739354 [Sabethes cyaneus]|uniref:uncharacterized protein LOC128739354 n=1 Tax=Sabethes cyaneus TaxID=53552 RepID=UPI00237E499C|nr:uncharacterized protein LOC128739354 [Sabethes cyaneus]
MTKLFDETRNDTGGAGEDGDMAWTKLLTDQSTPSPEIMKATVVAVDGASKQPKDVIVSIDPETGKEIVTQPAEGATGRRRESIIGTFHRQLRMSLKAVSEAPGPLTR